MKKLLIASLCSVFVFGTCAFTANDVNPAVATVSGGYVHVKV